MVTLDLVFRRCVYYSQLLVAKDDSSSKSLLNLKGGQVGYSVVCEIGTAIRASSYSHSWTQETRSLCPAAPVKAMIGPAFGYSRPFRWDGILWLAGSGSLVNPVAWRWGSPNWEKERRVFSLRELGRRNLCTFNPTLHPNLVPKLAWHPQEEGGTFWDRKSSHGVEDSSPIPISLLNLTVRLRKSAGAY